MFIKGHLERGNLARYVLFFKTNYAFGEDICFDLKGMPTDKWVSFFKKASYSFRNLEETAHLEGNPPFWKPSNFLESIFFNIRDSINSKRIHQTIDEYRLNDFDIYHFEQGVDPFRDGRWVQELARRRKSIVCFYHGSDIRNRGVIEAVHRYARLNLTCEIDLLTRLPGMKYLYLPIDTDKIKPITHPPSERIRIGHAARNRLYKGSNQIESVVNKLARQYPIDWVMIENVPHAESLEMKSTCDIFIDQITDLGGWGYGASSVESLAMGIPTITRINPSVADFLKVHPFISATPESLERVLIELIEEPDKRHELSEFSRNWVVENHGLQSVMNQLYHYYSEVGFL